MATENAAPKTLQEAIVFFADYQNCQDALVAVRWPDGIVKCPRCGSERVTYLANARVWKCYEGHPLSKFSLKVGTVFEDSPLPLQKWLPALWLLTNCKNGISSYELARALGVTAETHPSAARNGPIPYQNGRIVWGLPQNSRAPAQQNA